MYKRIAVFCKRCEKLLVVEGITRRRLGKVSSLFYVRVDVRRENVHSVAIHISIQNYTDGHNCYVFLFVQIIKI